MTRNSIIDLLKSIFDKKFPCRMRNNEVPSQKIDRIIHLNCPKDELLNLVFHFVHFEYREDKEFSFDYHLYNKTYDILLNVKTKYVVNIGDPSKSYWRIVGYEIK